MTKSIQLRGITWDHSRGLLPMVATAQRFHELHPNVQIHWHSRSLQSFADYSIARLASEFDLLVIDHPPIGEAAAHGLILPMDHHLPTDFLADQASNSVGGSHASYQAGGQQWALAVDAASPVASYRPDLLPAGDVPQTWEHLLDLAKKGKVALAAIPIDSLMHFYMMCLSEGETPGQQRALFCSEDKGVPALEALRELVMLCGPACLERNPIQVYEAMTRGDQIAYCPFAYGYSNYSRRGYARRPLLFGGLVTRHGQRLRSVLGGAGVAVSAASRHPGIAVAYAQFMATEATQTGIFTASGGQPGHRKAWLDAENNRAAQQYFAATLETLDQSWIRPRYAGYIGFQDLAGKELHAFLRGESTASVCLRAINQLHEGCQP